MRNSDTIKYNKLLSITTQSPKERLLPFVWVRHNAFAFAYTTNGRHEIKKSATPKKGFSWVFQYLALLFRCVRCEKRWSKNLLNHNIVTLWFGPNRNTLNWIILVMNLIHIAKLNILHIVLHWTKTSYCDFLFLKSPKCNTNMHTSAREPFPIR